MHQSERTRLDLFISSCKQGSMLLYAMLKVLSCANLRAFEVPCITLLICVHMIAIHLMGKACGHCISIFVLLIVQVTQIQLCKRWYQCF